MIRELLDKTEIEKMTIEEAKSIFDWVAEQGKDHTCFKVLGDGSGNFSWGACRLTEGTLEIYGVTQLEYEALMDRVVQKLPVDELLAAAVGSDEEAVRIYDQCRMKVQAFLMNAWQDLHVHRVDVFDPPPCWAGWYPDRVVGQEYTIVRGEAGEVITWLGA